MKNKLIMTLKANNLLRLFKQNPIVDAVNGCNNTFIFNIQKCNVVCPLDKHLIIL
jgi:hypothetical protein